MALPTFMTGRIGKDTATREVLLCFRLGVRVR